MSEMKIAVLGAAGRMGQTLARTIAATEGCVLAGGVEAKGSQAVGRDLGEVAGLPHLGIAITDDPLPLFAKIDGVLDFTTPKATIAFAELAAQARIVHVIGTTGFSAEDQAKIEAAARHAAIVKAGNMSLGVNLLALLTAKVARVLGPDFDIEIVELHHRHKRDAPSGHGADAWRGCCLWPGDFAQGSQRARPATATPDPGAKAISALPSCVAATWSVSTR